MTKMQQMAKKTEMRPLIMKILPSFVSIGYMPLRCDLDTEARNSDSPPPSSDTSRALHIC